MLDHLTGLRNSRREFKMYWMQFSHLCLWRHLRGKLFANLRGTM